VKILTHYGGILQSGDQGADRHTPSRTWRRLDNLVRLVAKRPRTSALIKGRRYENRIRNIGTFHARRCDLNLTSNPPDLAHGGPYGFDKHVWGTRRTYPRAATRVGSRLLHEPRRRPGLHGTPQVASDYTLDGSAEPIVMDDHATDRQATIGST